MISITKGLSGLCVWLLAQQDKVAESEILNITVMQ